MYDLEQLGLELKKTSSYSDEVKTLCLFHKDTTPSMFINRKSGVYHCFSCGASGNVRKLAEHLGVPMVMESIDTRKKNNLQDETWRDLLNAKVDISNTYLTGKRHLEPRTIEHFQLRSFAEGVFIPRMDDSGICTGGQVRHYEGIQRYKKVGYGEIYPLENLDTYVALVEGPFGVLNLWQQGVKAVTGYGAQALVNNKNWLLTLQRLSAIIMFDNDTAGYEAARAMLQQAPFLSVGVPGAEMDEINITPEEMKLWPMVKSVKELDRWLKYRG